MKYLYPLTIIFTLFCFSCQKAENISFNNSYLVGEWTHYNSKVIENNDTIEQPANGSVYYHFMPDNKITFKYSEYIAHWKILSNNTLSIDVEGSPQKATYTVQLLNEDEFIQSRNYNGKTFLYYFSRGW